MRSHVLAVAVLAAAAAWPAFGLTYCNTSPITIPTLGNGSLYPSPIVVAGLPAGLHAYEVTLNGFSHTFPDDLGIVLVDPGGQALLIQDGTAEDPVSDVTYTIADAAPVLLPDDTAWVAGRYKPAAYFTGDSFPAPGPLLVYNHPGPAAGNTATFASTFGANLNGTWNLFIRDFVTGDAGSVAGGWCLTVVPAKGDLNVDGASDLFFQQASSPGHNEAWIMSGTTRIGGQTAITPNAAATQQLRGADQFVSSPDGSDSLVWWDSTSGAVEFWLLNGATRNGAAVALTGAAPLATNWQIAATGDFNGDRHPDILWRNLTSQNLVIWTMNGTLKIGNIIPTPPQALDSNWRVVAALDYNADGARDLLWYNDTSGRIVVWYMDSNVVRITGAFTNPMAAGDANWKVVAGGDYGTGGGPLFANDIVWRNDTSGKLVVWNMDNAGNRVSGGFTTPDAPAPALDWNVVGPK